MMPVSKCSLLLLVTCPRHARKRLICIALFSMLSSALLLILGTNGFYSNNSVARGIDSDVHQGAGVVNMLRRAMAVLHRMFAFFNVQAGAEPKSKEQIRCEQVRTRLERGTPRFTIFKSDSYEYEPSAICFMIFTKPIYRLLIYL